MKILLIGMLVLVILSGCSVSPNSAQRKYTKLDRQFDSLVDDVVVESDRAKLERNYRNLSRRMNSSSDPAMAPHRERVEEKIQYLEDLAD